MWRMGLRDTLFQKSNDTDSMNILVIQVGNVEKINFADRNTEFVQNGPQISDFSN